MDHQTSSALWSGHGLSHLLQHPPESHSFMLKKQTVRSSEHHNKPLQYVTETPTPKHYHFKKTIAVCTFCKLLALIILHPMFLSFITPITRTKIWRPYRCSLHTFLHPVTSFPLVCSWTLSTVLSSLFFKKKKKKKKKTNTKTNFRTYTKQQVTFSFVYFRYGSWKG